MIANSYLHDNSKFRGLEWISLFGDNEELLSLAIDHHRQTNSHHVAYWGCVENMPKIFLAELVCDLHSRAAEFGTDLKDYLKDTFFPKHNIVPNSRCYKYIKEFVDLLLDKPFGKIE